MHETFAGGSTAFSLELSLPCSCWRLHKMVPEKNAKTSHLNKIIGNVSKITVFVVRNNSLHLYFILDKSTAKIVFRN